VVESWGNVETFVGMRLEIEEFTNEKCKIAAELSDRKWLRDLALLYDISYHLNDLNTKLQG
jgi:hypothetical protein